MCGTTVLRSLFHGVVLRQKSNKVTQSITGHTVLACYLHIPDRSRVGNWGPIAVDISGSLLAGRDRKTMHTECAKTGDRSDMELTLPGDRMKERPRTQ